MRLIATAVMATMLALPAYAAPIIKTYDITATNFTSDPAGVDPPVHTVHMNFTITLDIDGVAGLIGPTSTGLTLNSSNIALGQLQYGISPLGAALYVSTDLELIGNSFGFHVAHDTNSVGMLIGSALSDTPDLIEFIYAQATPSNTNAFFVAGTKALSEPPASVPEPASILIFGIGLITTSLVMRRKSI